MRKSKESQGQLGKEFWRAVVKGGISTNPGMVIAHAILLQQLNLQIIAADVSIRVQKNVPRLVETG